MAQKKKTDRPGILSSMTYLENQGYENIKNIHHPTDLQAEKGGELYWFEVKYTESKENAFGAATLTEWKCALENPRNFFFLIANKPGGVENPKTDWKHILIEPEEFLEISTIPPAKIYFTYSLLKKTSKPKRRSSTIQATKENLRSLIRFFEQMRNN